MRLPCTLVKTSEIERIRKDNKDLETKLNDFFIATQKTAQTILELNKEKDTLQAKLEESRQTINNLLDRLKPVVNDSLTVKNPVKSSVENVEDARDKVLKCLESGPKDYNEIAKECGLTLAHASTCLKRLSTVYNSQVIREKQGRTYKYRLVKAEVRKVNKDSPEVV